MARITIQDIAKEMNLSRNTVAKALNGGNVSIETKMAVIGKAMQMGYGKLDDQLRESYALYQRKMNQGTILVIKQKEESTFLHRVISGISDCVKELGMRMQLHMANPEEETSQELREQVGIDVRGIIFLSIFPIEHVKAVASTGVSITFLNTPVNAQEYIELGDVYSLESFYSMNKITSYCIEEKNCKTFAFIGFAQGSRGVQARLLGFMGACNQYGLKLEEKNLFTAPGNHKIYDYEEVSKALNTLKSIPDAIICENDDVARHVAFYLLQMDKQLAMDTVITGYDGTLEKDFFKKDMITVDVRMEELGKRLVESVIARSKNPQRDIAFVTITTYPNIKEA